MKNKLPGYLNQYFNTYLTMQKNLSSNTIKSYHHTFNIFFKYCMDIRNITIPNLNLDIFNADTIIGFLDYLETTKKNSIATKNNRLLDSLHLRKNNYNKMMLQDYIKIHISKNY